MPSSARGSGALRITSAVQRPRVILAIETSNPSAWSPPLPSPCGVALGRAHADGIEMLAVDPIDPTNTREDLLALAIDAAVSRARLRPRDLTDVAVSIGPGGFTAVRIAVTTAKMIAEATGAACLPVPSALVAAPPEAEAPFGVALASKGDSVHLTMFTPGGPPTATSRGTCAGTDQLFDELSRADARTIVADRFLPESVRAGAIARGIAIIPPAFSPEACLRAALRVQPVDPVALVPLYPREPEAVTKWRALHRE